MYSVDSTTVHGRLQCCMKQTHISLINVNRMDGQTNINPSSLCVCVYILLLVSSSCYWAVNTGDTGIYVDPNI